MTEYTCVVYIENDIELLWPTNKVWYVIKTKQDNDVTKRIGAIYVKNDIELSQSMRLSVVFDEDKIGNVTNRTSVVYVKNDIELSWPIRSSADYDKNQIE